MWYVSKKLFERIDDHFVSNVSHRKDWVIERRGDVKTVLSLFGQVTYQRTCFKNKKTGQYSLEQWDTGPAGAWTR
ncbi:MAG: hypothetical protein GX335_07035 [Firmicutes bacterium]|nr:hypothetical protein [Bacillota bacterium]